MKKTVLLVCAALAAGLAEARFLGLGLDAFNRVVPANASSSAVFSPLSFEIDSLVFAEAVDPIRRSIFANALHVADEFSAEYGPIARQPFVCPGTNGIDLVWAHVVVMAEPWLVDPAYRANVQDLYGVEVSTVKPARGVEAWIRTLFAGACDGWRLPPIPKGNFYSLHDIVSVAVEAAPTNGWKRLLATHAVYRQPLVGGADFYAIVPKTGRAVSSVRSRLTSVSVSEILAMPKAVVDPPVSVRLALPPIEAVSTNDLAGAFSYFQFPTAALKPFPAGSRPYALRQQARFSLRPAPAAPGAEPLDGPFLYFVHDSALNTIPAVGIFPGKADAPRENP